MIINTNAILVTLSSEVLKNEKKKKSCVIPVRTITGKLSFYQSSAKGRLDRVLRRVHVNCHDRNMQNPSKMKLQNERKLESKKKGKTLEEKAI